MYYVNMNDNPAFKMTDVEYPADPPKYADIAGKQKQHGNANAAPEKKQLPKTPTPSMGDDLSWKTVIFDYTQNTTIHGVRYITESSVFVVRKVLWFIMVTAAFSFFVYYSQDRLSFYFKFTKNINVEVEYLDKVPFPAVTFCNQNAFRISQVYDKGWYHTVKEIFTRTSASTKRKCGTSEFECKIDLSCISASRVCDVFPDCFDNSDEQSCPLCPLLRITTDRMKDLEPPLLQVINSSMKFEVQPLTFDDEQRVYITRQSPYAFIYKSDGYWIVADRHLSSQPLAKIMHYADAPQSTHEINESYAGDPDVWTSWKIWVNGQWQEDASFTINCAYAFLEELKTENGTIDRELSLELLYSNASHEQSEFIQSCKWKGKDCRNGDIAAKQTDMGVCYTFNASNMEIEQSGPGNGLSLVINVEQYEYTKNTEDGIGIKLLMHDITDVPMMQERGQAVSPGLFSFISVETTKVSNLKDPWGNCGEEALNYYDEYTITRCNVDCETRYIDKECKCREVQMPSKEGKPEVCTVGQYMDCAKLKLDEMRAAGNDCNTCPKPCDTTQYVPTTSFSVILGGEATSQDEKTFKLQEKLFKAREVTYRVVKEKYMGTVRNFHIINQQMLFMKKFTKYVNDSLELEYDDATTHALQVKADCVWMRNITFNAKNKVENDVLVSINDFKNVLLTLTTDAFVQLEALATETLDILQQTLQTYNDTWPLLIQNDPLHLDYMRPLDDYVNKTIQRNNVTMWQTVVALKSSLKQIKDEVHMKLKDKLVNMDTTPFQRFALNKTLLDPIRPDIGEHCDWCVQADSKGVIDILKDRVIAKFGPTMESKLDQVITEVETAMDTYLSEPWVKWFWSWVRFPITQAALTSFRTSVMSAFSIIQQMGTDTQEAIDDTNEVILLMDDLVSYSWGLQCQTKLPKLLNEYNGNQVVTSDMLLTLYKYIETQNGIIYDYQNSYSNNTKTLETVGTGIKFDEISNNVHGLKLRLDSSINDRSLLLNDIKKQINQIYFVIMAQTSSSDSLALISKYWGDFSISHPDAALPTTKKIGETELPLLDYAMLTDGKDDSYWHRLVDVLKNHQKNLQNQLDELDNKLALAEAYFATYISGNKINNDFYSKNFLNVELFYKELTENKVSQQKAYQYQNLLSELGGLMGLLLGASVLTIGEIADLFIYTAFRRCLKSKVAPAN